MAEITLFVALPFDFEDGGGIAVGEPIDCPSPVPVVNSIVLAVPFANLLAGG
jgi:hypothetical protein